jgi:hypothetical protein
LCWCVRRKKLLLAYRIIFRWWFFHAILTICSINYCTYLMNEANEARSVQQSWRTISWSVPSRRAA